MGIFSTTNLDCRSDCRDFDDREITRRGDIGGGRADGAFSSELPQDFHRGGQGTQSDWEWAFQLISGRGRDKDKFSESQPSTDRPGGASAFREGKGATSSMKLWQLLRGGLSIMVWSASR